MAIQKKTYKFSGVGVDYYLASRFSSLSRIVDKKTTILVTDEHVYGFHKNLFRGWNTIVLRAGEEYKIQATADALIDTLIGMNAGRHTTLVGVGGGVITDLTGYVASIFMRGIRFGFVPTTILAMVDAAIGGKNGVDVGVYKNMAGVIRQPCFLLYDATLLQSLPEAEWQNGFAEIIKHACIRDAGMFRQLEQGSISSYQVGKRSLLDLLQRNVMLKTKVVQKDEFEKNERRMLNFGHTLGHALENQYELSHGQAISIGMTYACHISEKLQGFKDTERVVALLEKYGLPTYASFKKKKVLNVLLKDKKRGQGTMNYILLQKIGKGVIQPIPLKKVEELILES